jgi:Spy/CpxP family protein refolding chaperone
MKHLLYFTFATLLLITSASAMDQSVQSTAPSSNGETPRHMHVPALGPVGGDWWKNSDIAQKINLSDGQKQQIQQIFSDHRSNLVVLRGNFENEEGKLRNLVNQDPPQDEQVLAQVDQVTAARGKLDREFAAITLAFRKVLSGDQWKQLQNITMQRFLFRRSHRDKGEGSTTNNNPSEPK